MKIQVQFYSFLLLFAFITSCSKDDDPVTPDPKNIYVSGYVDPTNSGQTRATYWKNGQPNYLSESTVVSKSKGIYVADNGDVYVCGYIQNSNFILNACYWKNGVLTNLGSATVSSSAEKIVVNGSDIYVIGEETNSSAIELAVLWKNGVKTTLSTIESYTRDLVVSGADVYVGGAQKNASGILVAKIWKNNVASTITNGTTTAAVFGLKVGGEGDYAKLWKNGNASYLSLGVNYAMGSKVDVVGSDVYVAGYEYNSGGFSIAKIWKNGDATSLSDGLTYSEAADLKISGSDVYAVGRYGSKAILWKNNVQTELSATGAANSIFIK